MRRGRLVVALCAVGVWCLGSQDALAQNVFERNIDAQSFRPAPGPYNFLTVAGARVDGSPAFSLSAWANYSYGAFTIYTANCPNATNDVGCVPGAVRARPVEHLMTLNLLPTLTLFRRLQIGIDLPVSFSIGDNARAADGMRQGEPGTRASFALSDPRLDLKFRIAGEGTRGPALAIQAFGQFGIGQFIATSGFLGDVNPVVFGGRVIGDFRTDRLALSLNLGALVRPQQAQVFSSIVSSRFQWGLAGSFDITPRFAALLEIRGEMDFANPDQLQQNTMEADLAARFRVGDMFLSAGGGAGILRSVGTPVARGFLGFTWAPVRVDQDRDGVPDEQDRCPLEREDVDGFEDQDGCPEPDNDGDGFPDGRDRCPTEAEDRDNFQDTDGCPEPDNDNDGIPDGYDSCDNEPEDRDGDRDDDGCPDDDRDRDGVRDEADRCPTEPEDTDGFEDTDGCPDPDNDHDGVPDGEDQCGDQPETINTFQDSDGCPDEIPDRDHDGIADPLDRCPDQPETYNGQADDDGCPERGPSLLRIEGGVIRILQQVNFATNSDRITGRSSFAVLDAVAAVLAAHPEMPRIEVQGHTDNQGDAAANRDLSQRRAAAVVTYLSQHGVDAARLTSRGFGPDVPLESNSSRRGRARNRRVEFHVIPAASATPAAGGAQTGTPASGTTPATTPATAPATTPATTPAPAGNSAAPAAPAPATPAPATPAPATN